MTTDNHLLRVAAAIMERLCGRAPGMSREDLEPSEPENSCMHLTLSNSTPDDGVTGTTPASSTRVGWWRLPIPPRKSCTWSKS